MRTFALHFGAALVLACAPDDRDPVPWATGIGADESTAAATTSSGAMPDGTSSGADETSSGVHGSSDDAPSDSSSEDASDGGSVGRCEGWTDPFPALPDANDPSFPAGTSWHVGPNGVEYQISIPEGDTAELPLVLTADIYNGGLRFEPVISLYFPVETGGHNAWIDDEFWNCWPGCSVFTFLGTDGTEALLLELGDGLRFAHDRVFMDGVGEGREEVTIALAPSLQRYFAGVVHYQSEWQMAECPQVASTTPDPCGPAVFFGISGCDHSFCPSQSCYDEVLAAGYDVVEQVGSDVGSCPCPLTDLGSIPHLLPMPDWIRDAHVSFVLETHK
jgi:hypothetical protein